MISEVSFPVAVGEGTVVDLYDLGRGLRLRGVRVTETGDGITVPAGPLYSIEMRSATRKIGTQARYKISWTWMGLLLAMAPLLVGLGGLVSIAIAIYVLFDERVKFDKTTRKTREAELPRWVEKRDDISQLLILSLTEANRIAADVRTIRHSRYQDVVLVCVFFIGLVGSLVLFITFAGLAGGATPQLGLLELVSAIVIAVALTVAVVLLARWRMSPNIKKADQWVERLDLATAREEAGVSADGESTIGLLIEVGAELPEWLRIREKGQLDNNAVMWIVALFLVWPAAYGFANGIGMLLANSGDPSFGLVMIAVSAALVFVAYSAYRYLLKQERTKSHLIKREWERRQQYLTRRLEELIEGM